MYLGTTFDFEQAQNVGLKWEDALQSIIRLGVRPVRIGIKWSRIEREKGKYRWDVYDHILTKLKENNVPIVLCVGMKSPRWPEFYIPRYIHEGSQLSNNQVIGLSNNRLCDHLFDFIVKTLTRYKSFDNVRWIQVENEPFFPFGPNKWSISGELLKKELQIVKNTISLPTIVTEQGLPTTGVLSEFTKGKWTTKKHLLSIDNLDIIGFNVFPQISGKLFGLKPHIYKASHFSWKYLEYWIQRVLKSTKQCWISELQSEPWESREVNYRDAYGNPTCNPDLVIKYISRIKTYGKKSTVKTLLWGTEFHLGCKQKGNPSWIKMYSHLRLTAEANILSS